MTHLGITGHRRACYCVPSASRTARNSVPYAAALLLLGGCATSSPQPLASAGQAKQVIVCTISPDADPARVLAAATEFGQLPNVLDVSGGYEPKAMAHPTTSPGEMVTLILTFRSEAALVDTLIDTKYLDIRDHQIKPLCRDVRTYQTTLRNYQVAEKYTEETTAADLQRRAAAIKQQNEIRGQTK